MARHISVEKRARQNIVRNQRNRAIKSTLKGAIKDFETATGDNAAAALVNVQKNLDHAVQRKIIHKNKAARKLSRLAHKLKKQIAGS